MISLPVQMISSIYHIFYCQCENKMYIILHIILHPASIDIYYAICSIQ